MTLHERWRRHRERVRQAEQVRRAAEAAEFDRRIAVGLRIAAAAWVGLAAALTVYRAEENR